MSTLTSKSLTLKHIRDNPINRERYLLDTEFTAYNKLCPSYNSSIYGLINNIYLHAFNINVVAYNEIFVWVKIK